jgi:hypothetical protein
MHSQLHSCTTVVPYCGPPVYGNVLVMKVFTHDSPTPRILSAQGRAEDLVEYVPTRPTASQRALEYVSKWGWPVMVGATPHLQRRDGRFAGGVLELSCEVERVRRWWREYPEAGIVSLAGAVFDVLTMPMPVALGFLDTLTDRGVWLGPIMANDEVAMFLVVTGQGDLWREALHNRCGSWHLGHGEPVCLPPGNPAAGQAVRWVVPPTLANAQVLPGFDQLGPAIAEMQPSTTADGVGRQR